MNRDAGWCDKNDDIFRKMYRPRLCDSVLKLFFCKLIFLWLVINKNVLFVVGDEWINTNNVPSDSGHYTATWAVHIPGGQADAEQIARDHGFINLGKVC